MKTTAIVNQKGGVGKTASTVNVGGALAALGRRVLLIELDPEGHLTKALRVEPISMGEPSLALALLNKWTGTTAELAVNHSTPNGGRLDVLPHSADMVDISRELDKMRSREHRLARVLAGLGDAYDHVLMDCPPSLDILTDNALTAADGVLIPVQTEDSSLHALELLLAQVDAVEIHVRDRPLVLHGLVVSMLERGPNGKAKSKIAQSVIEALEATPLPILASVPRGVPITEAWRYGKTVVEYAPDSEHAAAYRALANVLEAAT